MPDTFSLSAGVSLGLVAGIVSGVCYLFANGYTRPRDDERRVFKEKCIDTKRRRICGECGGDEFGGAVPCVCYHHQAQKFESGGWFLRQVQRAVSLMPWSFSTDKLEQIDEEHEGSETSETRVDLHHVRDFLEALSARLAGGTLEAARVAPLYDHPAYLPQTPGPRVPAPTSSASSAHSQLKRLVARVVEEAAALPALARYAAEPHTPVDSSTYEDLLATAILNKVIERYQTENGSGGRSSGIHSASASPSPSERSSPRDLGSRSRRDARDITPPLHEEEDVIEWEDGEGGEDAIELPRRVPFPEFGGDIVHPIENDLRDFDEVSGSDIQAVDGTWEENWLFQKKKINTIQSVPVPMLVPNSNTEYKALIGDRDADDTTDLSDNASEDEAEEVEYKSDVKKILDSKHIIGGQPKPDEVLDFEPDSLTIINGNESEDMLDSIENFLDGSDNLADKEVIHAPNDGHDSIMVIGVNSGPVRKAEFNLKEEIHRSIANGDHVDGYEDDQDLAEPYSIGADVKCSESSFTYTTSTPQNTFSRHEREGEYEETVTVPVQRYADSLRRKHFEDVADGQPSEDTVEDLIPGSIAYRERKKWLNYVDMPNNPYSPEAIKKRLTAKSTSSLFDTITSRNDSNDESLITEELKLEPDSLDLIEDKIEITKSATTDCVIENGRRSESPKILKDVLSEEIPQYKRYGRDYYIKEAKSSSGGRKYNSYSETSSISSSINKSTSLDNYDTEFASPGLLIKQFNTIAVNQEYTKFAIDKENISITTMPNEYNNEILIEYEDANEQTLFTAKPANTDDDTDKKFEEILESAFTVEKEQVAEIINDIIEEAQKSLVSIERQSCYSSSSLEDTIKIYNVQTGEIVKCKPEDNVSRYDVSDKNDNKDISDSEILGEDADKVSETRISNEDTIIINDFEESEKQFEGANELDDIPTQLPNVRELAKKFTSMESLSEPMKPSQHLARRRKSKENIADERPGAKLNYMHSLTARSISKEFRDELKLSMAIPLTVPGGAKEIPEGTDDITRESSRPGSPLPEPGTIKTKLAFFESLKSKFSNK